MSGVCMRFLSAMKAISVANALRPAQTAGRSIGLRSVEMPTMNALEVRRIAK